MDQERWKDYDNGIAVSSWGRVKRYGRVFVPQTITDGYRAVYIKNRRVKLHHLVLYSFKGEPSKNQVARHLDGNRLNNSLDNLEWGTVAKNHLDAVEHGTHSGFLNRGTGNYFSKLDEDSVLAIREAYLAGQKKSQLANQYNVTTWTINSIIKRSTWRHV